MLNKKQATDLAKAWRLGNRFRKKSLTKKHNIAPATSKNTGRVKMGIRMDIESKPQEYYPALDDDGALVFFSGRPMKRIPVSDLFTPPKAGKNRQRVPAKENAMINHKLKILETLFPNETDILESFLESHDLDINDYSIMTIQEQFKSFKIQLEERTEFQLVAQKGDGTELKSSWYKDENELTNMQQACEDSDDYESTSVMKRIVDVDEDEDNEEEFSSILPTDYTDGEEIEAGQNFSEDEVEEGKDVDYKELYKLTNLALKQIPGSPKQRETIKKLNLIRKKAGMKPLSEMEIDMNDEVNESVNEASEKQLLIKDLKMLIKNPDARMVKMYGGGNKYVDMLKKKLTKLESIEEATAAQLGKLSKQDILDLLKVFKGVTRAKKTVSMLTKELSLRKNESVEEDAISRAKEKADLKKKHEAEREAEKEEIKSINSEEVEIEESKALDKLKFKGSDKKTAGNVVYMIKRGDTPKEIAAIFKKLKTPSQEAIMTALGDRSSKDLLQKGKLLNSLISLFDEVDPKGLDGRSKEFKNKVKKLEYNKKKKLPYDVFEKKVVKEKKMAGLEKKADKSGMPYGILKQVFNRGVAAWRTGHRPGTNPQQWGYARVNSFVTKSKGTWGGADKDLAAKVRK